MEDWAEIRCHRRENLLKGRTSKGREPYPQPPHIFWNTFVTNTRGFVPGSRKAIATVGHTTG